MIGIGLRGDNETNNKSKAADVCVDFFLLFSLKLSRDLLLPIQTQKLLNHEIPF